MLNVTVLTAQGVTDRRQVPLALSSENSITKETGRDINGKGHRGKGSSRKL